MVHIAVRSDAHARSTSPAKVSTLSIGTILIPAVIVATLALVGALMIYIKRRREAARIRIISPPVTASWSRTSNDSKATDIWDKVPLGLVYPQAVRMSSKNVSQISLPGSPGCEMVVAFAHSTPAMTASKSLPTSRSPRISLDLQVTPSLSAELQYLAQAPPPALLLPTTRATAPHANSNSASPKTELSPVLVSPAALIPNPRLVTPLPSRIIYSTPVRVDTRGSVAKKQSRALSIQVPSHDPPSVSGSSQKPTHAATTSAAPGSQDLLPVTTITAGSSPVVEAAFQRDSLPPWDKLAVLYREVWKEIGAKESTYSPTLANQSPSSVRSHVFREAAATNTPTLVLQSLRNAFDSPDIPLSFGSPLISEKRKPEAATSNSSSTLRLYNGVVGEGAGTTASGSGSSLSHALAGIGLAFVGADGSDGEGVHDGQIQSATVATQVHCDERVSSSSSRVNKREGPIPSSCPHKSTVGPASHKIISSSSSGLPLSASVPSLRRLSNSSIDTQPDATAPELLHLRRMASVRQLDTPARRLSLPALTVFVTSPSGNGVQPQWAEETEPGVFVVGTDSESDSDYSAGGGFDTDSESDQDPFSYDNNYILKPLEIEEKSWMQGSIISTQDVPSARQPSPPSSTSSATSASDFVASDSSSSMSSSGSSSSSALASRVPKLRDVEKAKLKVVLHEADSIKGSAGLVTSGECRVLVHKSFIPRYCGRPSETQPPPLEYRASPTLGSIHSLGFVGDLIANETFPGNEDEGEMD